ncbi:MAG: amidohydrolase family protein [Armatimonadota bacterium]|nr:amidohydrolase family protein [Armatimonadota bacterium]MDR5703406.1 amidohydrolase family protein [Armatimonadota bacterium]MDR7434850.1 amidohydrolase family protein [Armatimonadota bacterium]
MRSQDIRTIDVHSHFFPASFLQLVQEEGPRHGARVEVREVALLAMPGHPQVRLIPPFVDVGARVEAMDAMGIDVQALSLPPPMVYWAPADLGRELARAFNDGILDVCRRVPGRFVGLATLPLQDIDASLEEMERSVRDLGMRGIHVGASVNGSYLDDPRFLPMWELAHALDVTVFTHPQINVAREVLDRHHLFNTLGFPMDTTVMAARMIYSGLLERLPKLRIVLAHGGGVLPYLLGRLDHSYSQRRECQEAIPEPPSRYMRNFYFDTLTHSDAALSFLISVVGPNRIVLGTDAPFDMADRSSVARVRRLGLSQEMESAVLKDTACMLLKMK